MSKSVESTKKWLNEGTVRIVTIGGEYNRKGHKKSCPGITRTARCYNVYFSYTSIVPVISGGMGRPMILRMVGATSPSLPGFKVPLKSLLITK